MPNDGNEPDLRAEIERLTEKLKACAAVAGRMYTPKLDIPLAFVKLNEHLMARAKFDAQNDIKAEVERMRSTLIKIADAAESSYWENRHFIDNNVPGWIRGDDGPSYSILRVAGMARGAIGA